jgi:Ca2+-binding EF-hand superfamily protein
MEGVARTPSGWTWYDHQLRDDFHPGVSTMRAFSSIAATALVLTATLLARGQFADPDRVRELLERLDANKDGRVEKSEVPAAQLGPFQQMLSVADANKNGVIDRDEVPTILTRARNQAAAKAKAQENITRMFREMDKNNDGKVGRDEFTSYADYFDRLDANKDGFLVPDEIRPPMGNLLNKSVPYLPPPRSSTGLVSLTELKTGTYQDKQGGLYPGGSNERPMAHEEAGLRLARSVQPLDAQGKPAADGKIVLLSIGMSNTTMEFSAFMEVAKSEPGKNPRLVIVDGAQGGRTARVFSRPENPPGKETWEIVDQRLADAGVTRAQVQVAWMKQANGMPMTTRFPDYAVTLEDEMLQIAQILKERFPNTKLFYLSSRIYGGYATTPLNPEPYAYEGGFSVKWLIEKQIAGAPALNFDPSRGPVKAPWLAWGPYLWADGTKPRAGDGLTYARADLAESDGTHPSPAGSQKVARQLLDFFKTDSTARIWFLGAGGSER